MLSPRRVFTEGWNIVPARFVCNSREKYRDLSREDGMGREYLLCPVPLVPTMIPSRPVSCGSRVISPIILFVFRAIPPSPCPTRASQRVRPHHLCMLLFMIFTPLLPRQRDGPLLVPPRSGGRMGTIEIIQVGRKNTDSIPTICARCFFSGIFNFRS